MKKIEALREKAIDAGYEPNVLAEYFIQTPSAEWRNDGFYNLGNKYSNSVTDKFLDNIEKFLMDHERTKIENLNRPEIKISINFNSTENVLEDIQTVVGIVEDIVEMFRGEKV